MNRATIRTRFRAENPELSARVLTDSVLNGFMLDADKDICNFTKCIVSNTPETFNSVANTQYYDLTANIAKFQEIDEYPGGGVWYNYEPLRKCTESEMNYVMRTWRNASSGTPQKYFRRGKYLWFDYKPSASSKEIAVSTVYISDDFDDDTKTPFNQLSYLEPYHPGILKYCQWKAKQLDGKDQEAGKAEQEYYNFVKRMKMDVSGGQNSAAHLIFRGNMSNS